MKCRRQRKEIRRARETERLRQSEYKSHCVKVAKQLSLWMVFNLWAPKELKCIPTWILRRRDEMEKSNVFFFIFFSVSCAINVYMMRPNGIRCGRAVLPLMSFVHWPVIRHSSVPQIAIVFQELINRLKSETRRFRFYSHRTATSTTTLIIISRNRNA